MHSYPLPRYFDKFWVAEGVKNTLKLTFLPLFGHTRSSVGKTHFWRGKWQPMIQVDIGGHPPIPLGPPPFSLSVSAQLTIFSNFLGPELLEPF